jgi:hypothetical protein
MKIRLYSFLVLLAIGATANGQTIKGDVVVLGGTPSGFAAAIQAANSGVKTILLDAGSLDAVTISEADKQHNAGIFAGFLKQATKLQKTPAKAGDNFTPAFTATVLKTWTDSVKNLTVIRNGTIRKVERSGNWEIDLTDKREIKASFLVDATGDAALESKTGVRKKAFSTPRDVYGSKLYRTSVAAAPGQAGFLPISALLVADLPNFIQVPVSAANMFSGQAAGATAAYCAFFKTNTKNVAVRMIQGELLGYQSHLFEFTDLALADSNYRSIQNIALTGLLKGSVQDGRVAFNPNGKVSFEDLRAPMREFYTRSQIWFLDHKFEHFTIGEAISLIKFCASRGNELDKEIAGAWKSFNFTTPFDLNRPITRRELAVLFDNYLKPFDRAVDTSGNLKS